GRGRRKGELSPERGGRGGGRGKGEPCVLGAEQAVYPEGGALVLQAPVAGAAEPGGGGEGGRGHALRGGLAEAVGAADGAAAAAAARGGGRGESQGEPRRNQRPARRNTARYELQRRVAASGTTGNGRFAPRQPSLPRRDRRLSL
ncbi:unnamed protein product, partial [Scytosiphon promiscuus]